MRKYLIGVIACLVGALTFPSIGSADTTALTITSPVTPSKQDKKVRGGVSTVFTSTDTHAGDLPCPTGTVSMLSCYAYPPSTNAFITFPSDFKFDPGTLPDCSLGSLQGKGTASARAACPRSIVGGGSNVQAFSDGRILQGVITAFNGTPSGGNPSLYLHVDLPGVASKPILSGVFRGNSLSVAIPPVPGSVIENFSTSINRIVTRKTKNKRTGKVKKTFYLSAKCSKGTWSTTETVTYSGIKTLTDSTSSKCTQKKKK
jgi:hypothetical protein